VTAQPLDLAPIRARLAAYREHAHRTTAAATMGLELGITAGGPAQAVAADVPVLLALADEQAAIIARYDTALIEATRDAEPDEADDDLPTREALIETIAAAEAGRDLLTAEVAELRADHVWLHSTRDQFRAAWKQECDRSAKLAAERDEAQAEIARLRSASTRAATVLDDLIEYATDPGVEALGARWELRHELGRTCVPAELLTPAVVPPLPTTENFRVVLRDEDADDEPHRGWQQIGSTVRTRAEAQQQMATRRRHHPDWPGMAIWRQQHTWSVAAVETRDASRAPESAQDAPDPSNDPTPG